MAEFTKLLGSSAVIFNCDMSMGCSFNLSIKLISPLVGMPLASVLLGSVLLSMLARVALLDAA